MKRTLLFLVILITLAACSDDMPVATNEVETFSKQLVGQWEIEYVDITPVHTSKPIDLRPSKDYVCNQLSTAFQSKDVVSKFCIQFNDGTIKVNKYYTCILPPEQLSWRIELDQTADTSINWETGNVFTINEINEGAIQATYRLLFFNLDHNSPNGEHVTSGRANQLWLEVAYDTKESSKAFNLKLKKVQ